MASVCESKWNVSLAVKGGKVFEWSSSLSEFTKLTKVFQGAETEAASMATTPPSSISKAHSEQHKGEKLTLTM